MYPAPGSHEGGKALISVPRGGEWVGDELLNCSRRDRGADELGHRDVTSSYTGKFNKNVVIRDFIFDSVD